MPSNGPHAKRGAYLFTWRETGKKRSTNTRGDPRRAIWLFPLPEDGKKTRPHCIVASIKAAIVFIFMGRGHIAQLMITARAFMSTSRFATRQRITLTTFHLQQICRLQWKLPSSRHSTTHHLTSRHPAVYHRHIPSSSIHAHTHMYTSASVFSCIYLPAPAPPHAPSKPRPTPQPHIHWLTIVDAKKHPQHLSVT
jgi:hypothetical protein